MEGGKSECSVRRLGAETGREALKKQAGGWADAGAGLSRASTTLSPPRQLVSARLFLGTLSQARPAAPHPPS